MPICSLGITPFMRPRSSSYGAFRAAWGSIERQPHTSGLRPTRGPPVNSTGTPRDPYSARMNSTRSRFSGAVSLVPRIRLKNSTVSSSVSRR